MLSKNGDVEASYQKIDCAFPCLHWSVVVHHYMYSTLYMLPSTHSIITVFSSVYCVCCTLCCLLQLLLLRDMVGRLLLPDGGHAGHHLLVPVAAAAPSGQARAGAGPGDGYHRGGGRAQRRAAVVVVQAAGFSWRRREQFVKTPSQINKRLER